MVSPSHGATPASLTSRISTKGMAGPCFARYAYCASASRASIDALRTEAVPIGVISVMPQAWMVRMPCLSKPRIIASLAAEPPTTVRKAGSRFHLPGAASSAWRTPFQIVGTPAASVTRSAAQRSSRLVGSRWGPGRTQCAPAMATACASPQAFAWNMGTTGMTRSRWRMPKGSVMQSAKVCSTMARCE